MESQLSDQSAQLVVGFEHVLLIFLPIWDYSPIWQHLTMTESDVCSICTRQSQRWREATPGRFLPLALVGSAGSFKLPHSMHLWYVPKLGTLKIDSLSSFSPIFSARTRWGIPILRYPQKYCAFIYVFCRNGSGPLSTFLSVFTLSGFIVFDAIMSR